MKLMLNHVDSPYIRCVGFLYLRYVCEPTRLWEWVFPYLYDQEPVQISASSSKRQQAQMTVGDYVRSLLTDLDYMGTRLPRLPVAIERDMKVKMLEAERIEHRAMNHTRDSYAMKYFESVGSRIRALYGDEENPIMWYEAVVDRVVRTDDETGVEFARPKFLVTFPEYGNTELVTLGEIDLPGGRDDRRGDSRDMRGNRNDYDDRSRNGQSRKRDRHERDWSSLSGKEHFNDDKQDLMQEVLRRERENSAAKGKAYASRPATFKETLSGPRDGGRYSGDGGSGRDYHSRRGTTQQYHRSKDATDSTAIKGKETSPSSSSPPPKQKTAEELAAIQEKKRKLMAKYG